MNVKATDIRRRPAIAKGRHSHNPTIDCTNGSSATLSYRLLGLGLRLDVTLTMVAPGYGIVAMAALGYCGPWLSALGYGGPQSDIQGLGGQTRRQAQQNNRDGQNKTDSQTDRQTDSKASIRRRCRWSIGYQFRYRTDNM